VREVLPTQRSRRQQAIARCKNKAVISYRSPVWQLDLGLVAQRIAHDFN
jgi:hypothetical protein